MKTRAAAELSTILACLVLTSAPAGAAIARDTEPAPTITIHAEVNAEAATADSTGPAASMERETGDTPDEGPRASAARPDAMTSSPGATAPSEAERPNGVARAADRTNPYEPSPAPRDG